MKFKKDLIYIAFQEGVLKCPLNVSKRALALCHLLPLLKSVLTIKKVSKSGQLTLLHPNGSVFLED